MLFIDLRASVSGGICAEEATFWEDGTVLLAASDFASRVQGKDLVLATHGFNVGRNSGVESLKRWNLRCKLPGSSLFIGILWPGDSQFLPVLDYPIEGNEAIKSGRLLARTLNKLATGAASLSLVSHSLGARTILEATKNLQPKVRCLVLMAGAIENDCLIKEYRKAADNAAQIFVLSSRKDWVLKFAFPIGNPIGEIVMHGHPYFRTAIGLKGPAQPISIDKRGGVCQIPDAWEYGHGNYLPGDSIGAEFVLPVPIPDPATEKLPREPRNDDDWPAWSAAVVATQLR